MTKEFDWSKLDLVLQLNGTKGMCAEFLQTSEDTIERRIKKKHGLTFLEYRERKVGLTVIKLAQKLIGLGMNGNVTALIFALKNLGKWSDKLETSFSEDAKNIIKLNYKLQEISNGNSKDIDTSNKD